MNIFHRHNFKKAGQLRIIKHQLDNGSWDTCPYSGCTKQYQQFMCSCGEQRKVEITVE